MIDLRLPALLLWLSAPAAAGDDQQRPPEPHGRMAMGSIIIQQRIIIRVPRIPAAIPAVRPGSALPPAPPTTWVEKGSEKCVPATDLAGAAFSRPDSVDLVLNGGKRLRARLASDCPALAFYSGFYLRPTEDGKVCAKRDAIRSRSGGVCRIESLRRLVSHR